MSHTQNYDQRRARRRSTTRDSQQPSADLAHQAASAPSTPAASAHQQPLRPAHPRAPIARDTARDERRQPRSAHHEPRATPQRPASLHLSLAHQQPPQPRLCSHQPAATQLAPTISLDAGLSCRLIIICTEHILGADIVLQPPASPASPALLIGFLGFFRFFYRFFRFFSPASPAPRRLRHCVRARRNAPQNIFATCSDLCFLSFSLCLRIRLYCGSMASFFFSHVASLTSGVLT